MDRTIPKVPELRLLAFETTRSCNLNCVHCRASSQAGHYSDELTTKEAKELLQDLVKVGRPIVILTGGEPLLRQDIFEIARYGSELGLRMVLATNGTLIDKTIAHRIKESGIKRVSISLDGNDSHSHDSFRKVYGAYDQAIRGIEVLKKAGIEFQINTTIVDSNKGLLPQINQKALELGAVAHHIFMLVPVGRGKEILDLSLQARDYEETLGWFLRRKDEIPIQLKATCAPQYYRMLRQEAKEKGQEVTFKTHGLDAVTRGCLGGIGFCFVSHRGKVQPCGYLELECGDIRAEPFSFIWENSPVFGMLRDYSRYKGKCGSCEYLKVCGGCRARAYEYTGDFLAEEPLCTYIPKSMRS